MFQVHEDVGYLLVLLSFQLSLWIPRRNWCCISLVIVDQVVWREIFQRMRSLKCSFATLWAKALPVPCASWVVNNFPRETDVKPTLPCCQQWWAVWSPVTSPCCSSIAVQTAQNTTGRKLKRFCSSSAVWLIYSPVFCDIFVLYFYKVCMFYVVFVLPFWLCGKLIHSFHLPHCMHLVQIWFAFLFLEIWKSRVDHGFTPENQFSHFLNFPHEFLYGSYFQVMSPPKYFSS